MQYSVIPTPEPEGGFTITVPAFPEYVGFADTEKEALVLARGRSPRLMRGGGALAKVQTTSNPDCLTGTEPRPASFAGSSRDPGGQARQRRS